MKNVLVVMPFEERHKEMLRSVGPEENYIFTSYQDVTASQAAMADVIIGNIDMNLLGEGCKADWLQLNSAGAAMYCKDGLLPKESVITCATGAYGLAVSEHMLTLTMMLCRKMDLYSKGQTKHAWKSMGKINSIWNSTTLVLGLGDIGMEYAQKMKALGSHVIGFRRNPSSEKPDCVDELYTIDQLDEVLPRADFVAMVLPGTAETRNLIGEKQFGLMKNSAYLINAGRGNSVNTEALMKALNEGQIAGAALDVTDPEPLPEDHPLWDTPRCIITPHVAGHFFLQETFERIVRITVENYRHYLAGEKDQMRNIVNKTTGYRQR